ncbi:MAG: hypothetical protein ACRDZY_13835, partial [Acidimicrobiales bacterium]
MPVDDSRWQIRLQEDDVPTAWYNLLADLPFDLPEPRSAAAGRPAGTPSAGVVAQIPLSMYRQGTGRPEHSCCCRVCCRRIRP